MAEQFEYKILLKSRIRGTDTYNVSIDMNRISDSSSYHCDCPYAYGGSNCRYMAALLYYYDEHYKDNDSVVDSKDGTVSQESV